MRVSKAKFIAADLTCLALLTAMQVVLSRFLSFNTLSLKIGFAFLPVAIGAAVLGPVGGAIVGGLGDFLGAILFPIGPYFPGFTLSCALTGLVFDALGMIPDDGEQDITLEAEGMRIHVTSIADHQVNAAQVWLLPKEAPPEDEE